MVLTEIEFISGLFCLIVVIVLTTLGLIISLKYFKYKQRPFLLFGITVAGFSEPHYGPGFSFLSALITGKGLSVEIYLLIEFVGIPFSLLCFVTFVTDLLYKNKQKIIQLIFLFYGIIFEIYLIYFLIYNPSLVGVLVGTTDAEYKAFAAIYMISVLLVVLVCGTLIVRQSLKSDKPELKLRGKLFLPAFYIFVISGVLDAVAPLNTITLPLNRILFILSGVLFYMGFILPNWTKKLFLKKNQISTVE